MPARQIVLKYKTIRYESVKKYKAFLRIMKYNAVVTFTNESRNMIGYFMKVVKKTTRDLSNLT
jgi:hypothetical protein